MFLSNELKVQIIYIWVLSRYGVINTISYSCNCFPFHQIIIFYRSVRYRSSNRNFFVQNVFNNIYSLIDVETSISLTSAKTIADVWFWTLKVSYYIVEMYGTLRKYDQLLIITFRYLSLSVDCNGTTTSLTVIRLVSELKVHIEPEWYKQQQQQRRSNATNNYKTTNTDECAPPSNHFALIR